MIERWMVSLGNCLGGWDSKDLANNKYVAIFIFSRLHVHCTCTITILRGIRLSPYPLWSADVGPRPVLGWAHLLGRARLCFVSFTYENWHRYVTYLPSSGSGMKRFWPLDGWEWRVVIHLRVLATKEPKKVANVLGAMLCILGWLFSVWVCS
jgi:hypothetical protein